MKQFRECATIRSGDTAVAYFVSDTSMVKNPSKREEVDKLPWAKVSASEFERLVKQDRVQELVWENNSISCQFTREERKVLRRVKADYLKTMTKTYWTRDPKYNKEHIEFAEQGDAMAVAILGVIHVSGFDSLLFSVYGTPENIGNLISRKETLSERGVALFSEGTNHFLCAIPLVSDHVVTRIMEELSVPIDALGRARPLFDTTTARNTLKIGALVKSVGANKYIAILNMMDSVSADNLYFLGKCKPANVERTSVFGG